ncbi:hypothetical protein MOKP120_30020 [Mycobacterium avium subsp. hominissuis]
MRARAAACGWTWPRSQPPSSAHSGSAAGAVSARPSAGGDSRTGTSIPNPAKVPTASSPSSWSAAPVPMISQRSGSNAAAASVAALSSASSSAAVPASSGTSTGADGTMAMTLSTPPN